MKFVFVQYIDEIRERIPLNRFLGYQRITNPLILFNIFEDIIKFSLTCSPKVLSTLEAIKYISIIVIYTIWNFSRQQSIVDLISIYLLSNGRKGGGYYYFMTYLMGVYPFISIFYVANDTLLVSAVISCIMIVLNITYFIAQYKTLKYGADLQEIASGCMLTK